MIDMMLDRALFLIEATHEQVKEWHQFERKIDRPLTGYEIANSIFAGKFIPYQTGIATSSGDWGKFTEDIKKIAPWDIPQWFEDWDELDRIHSWSWSIFHKIKKADYRFVISRSRKALMK